MRRLAVFLAMLVLLACPLARADTDFGIGVSLPGISIGINQPAYPDLAPIPGYPVYYAPNSPYNYFFYDGLFWVFIGDAWYSSSWYDGPWDWVDPLYVPAFLLRVPVRYYLAPPVYFSLWAYDYAPHWGDHWGDDWDRRRWGWDRWDRNRDWQSAPRPDYQRRYSGNRYPRQRDQQFALRDRNYSYQPRETLTRRNTQLARSADRRTADRTGGSRDRRGQRAIAPDQGRSAGARTAPRTDRDTRIASGGRDGRHASPRTRTDRAPGATTRRDTRTHATPPRAAPRELALNDRRGSSRTQRAAPPSRDVQRNGRSDVQRDSRRNDTLAQRSAPRHAQRDDRRAPSSRAAPPRDSRIARAEPRTKRSVPSSRQQRDSFAQRSAPQRHERIARAEPRMKRSAPAPRYERQQRSPQRAAPQQPRERAPTTMAQRQPRSSHAQQPRTEQRRSDSRQEKLTRDSDKKREQREQRRRVQYSA